MTQQVSWTLVNFLYQAVRKLPTLLFYNHPTFHDS